MVWCNNNNNNNIDEIELNMKTNDTNGMNVKERKRADGVLESVLMEHVVCCLPTKEIHNKVTIKEHTINEYHH